MLGVIGGSGFYQMKGLDKVELMELETPFGRPSDPLYQGRIGDIEVVFLARHGRGHRLLPSEINYRANVFGMKQLGVTHLVSVSTAGSLKLEIHPGELVVPDQFIDRTIKRPMTFFGDGLVAHVSLADPVCANLASDLTVAARAGGSAGRSGRRWSSRHLARSRRAALRRRAPRCRGAGSVRRMWWLSCSSGAPLSRPAPWPARLLTASRGTVNPPSKVDT